VTVLELLSPANKTSGKDRDAYLAKRQDYLHAGTNLVELDLLRRGLRCPVYGPLPQADYYILVCPGVDCPSAGIWPLSIRDRFPLVPVPLGSAEQPVLLALKPCLDEAYDEAQFSREIDYNQPPPVPFNDQDAAWVQELLGPIKG
jgi:hypothetical protein